MHTAIVYPTETRLKEFSPNPENAVLFHVAKLENISTSHQGGPRLEQKRNGFCHLQMLAFLNVVLTQIVLPF